MHYKLILLAALLLSACSSAPIVVEEPDPLACCTEPTAGYDGAPPLPPDIATAMAAPKPAPPPAHFMPPRKYGPRGEGIGLGNPTTIGHGIPRPIPIEAPYDPRAEERITTMPPAMHDPEPAKPLSIDEQISIPARLELLGPEQSNFETDLKVVLKVTPESLKSIYSFNAAEHAYVVTKKVSNIIQANIDAPDFDVTTSSPTEQVVSVTESTEWYWTLSPKAAGRFTVKVTVDSIVTYEGKERKRAVRTLERDIVVTITPWQVVKVWWLKNWQWAWTAIIVPVFLYVWKRKKTRKK